ncbi:hypothetical protein B0H15DRAFT_28806 [Mycena belliarum]|uniref:F-box domain-containing protein n=1 Tax=Mycena belliarum TaxID=1033014 RepID=A0AAD6XYJ8_9AGAR|nr:hypothetical protein B0H15DRAFT_28806 [Mycena belliae]
MSPLLSLPNELLLVVFHHLQDPYPLYPLSTLCRRLHFLSLPIYLSRRGIYNETCGNISISAEQIDVLPALQTSLFLNTVPSLCCAFPNPYSDQDLARFLRVCCTLQSVGAAKLQFAQAPSSNDDYTEKMHETYLINVVNILNKVLEKSCTTLTIEATPDEISAITRARFSSKRGRGMRPVSQAHLLTSRISLSPAALRQSTLTTFRLHSPLLFTPHCRAWTIDVLNSFHLSSLSINAPAVAADVFNGLLSQTEIPTLSDLSMVNCRIAPAHLHLFLARHPSISSLHLDNMFVPSAGERLPPGFLPQLASLSAPAPQIAYFFHALPPAATLRTVRVLCHMTHVDLRLTDTSLRAAAPRLAPPVALALVLPVPASLPRVIPDVDMVFDADTDSALRFVSTLAFVFADDDAALGPVKYAAIAKWAAPFPALRTVELVGSRSTDTAPILAAFQARAPDVERVVWHGIVDMNQ